MSKNFIPDISHHDLVSSWTKIKNQCHFLIFKATQGTYYTDPTLKINIQKCEEYQIPYWTYTFLTKGYELAQAKYLVSSCKNKVGKYFIGYILDVQRSSKAEDIQIALNWLNKQGYKTMLYTQYYEYDKYKEVIKNRDAACAWWQPRYGPNDGKYHSSYPHHKGVDLHQYTENGVIDGIKGKVDLNRLTGLKPLEWFVTPLSINNKNKNKTQKQKQISYTGTDPTLPPRGYYQKGDGISTLANYPTQLKRMQELLNWIARKSLDSTTSITIDGQFGQKTENKVKEVQKILGISVTGKFDQATLKAAKGYKSKQ